MVLPDTGICRGGFETRPRAAIATRETGSGLRMQGGFEARPYQKALAAVSLKNQSGASAVEGARKLSLRRLAPLIVIACISIVVLAMGWWRQISFESLVRHHDSLRSFIAAHQAAALAGYVAVYIAIAGLSLPAGAYLTVIGGI